MSLMSFAIVVPCLLNILQNAPPSPPQPNRLSRALGADPVQAADIKPKCTSGFVVWSMSPLSGLEVERLAIARQSFSDLTGYRLDRKGVIWVARDIHHYRVMLHHLDPGGDWLKGSAGVNEGKHYIEGDIIIVMGGFPNRSPSPDASFLASVLTHEATHHFITQALGVEVSKQIALHNQLFDEGLAEYIKLAILPVDEWEAWHRAYLPVVERLLAEQPTTEGYHAAADEVKPDLYEHGYAILSTAMMFEEDEVRRILRQMIASRDDAQEVVRLSLQINAMATHERLTAWTKHVRRQLDAAERDVSTDD
ncbi:MAG: DUF2268 domain-containing putative Zn-dependent protease [Phycisphaerae bacterium]